DPDPTRQLLAPFAEEQPAHLPELLLRMPDVQRQGRAPEQPPQPLLQAGLAVDDDLHGLVCPGREPAARRLHPRPVQRRPPRSERPEHLLVDRAVQPTVVASPQGVHHDERGAAAVLALVPLLPPHLPAPALPLGAPPMPLTPAAPLVVDPRAAPPRQLLLGRRGGRLAVDLDDQHLTVVLGQGACAEV